MREIGSGDLEHNCRRILLRSGVEGRVQAGEVRTAPSYCRVEALLTCHAQERCHLYASKLMIRQYTPAKWTRSGTQLLNEATRSTHVIVSNVMKFKYTVRQVVVGLGTPRLQLG